MGEPPPEPSVFEEVESKLNSLVTARATWQVPRSLVVDQPERIGLMVGEGPSLAARIDDLIRESVPRAAGEVKVGPDVRVSLLADRGDADIEPSESVNQSTGEEVALLWTWIVRAKHPADTMQFTAHFEVPSDKHTFPVDLPLVMRVERTVGYTVRQVFVNWQTLSAIAVAAAGVVAWLTKRRWSTGLTLNRERPSRRRLKSFRAGQRRGGNR
ncbi:hypothetical protein [Actinoplanes awajinensis]|uniref:hypothetical protein n=1 Tax=Actinoplanes awajinensis TaxID=135946 RepID=UPI0012F90D67|nr:hypothetical protein [Actinoplanes awajinensis]